MTESTSTRRELHELRTLYTLNPHFRDVIVEGRDDAAWVRWYLSEHGIEHVKVFAVDDRVTVPREIVVESHRDVNARGRVIALAKAYENWQPSQPSLTCIADSDYDVFDTEQPTASLLKTDFAAMEVYALAERPLSKFLVASAKSSVAANSLISILKPAWATLYALRYVLHRHSDGMALTDKFANKCVDNSGQMVADARGLLVSCSPSPTRDVLDQLLSIHADYLAQIPDDPLQGIRGHDIAPLVIRFLRLKNSMARPDEVERLMRQSIELRDLDEFDLFKSLRSRLVS